ncbi:hypothetical protein [Acinetobacter guillouiae]|uniref:hypothetical protein n=1 Tax=Acinetobacter guillouiae TaxID=106649 RepID=UPI002E2519EC
MRKMKTICLWWLKEKNFKILVGSLSLKIKIGVLKILILMAIKLKGTENILKISSKDVSLNSKIILSSLCWLSEVKIITLIDKDNLIEKSEYLVKYCFQEEELKNLYDEYWVELPIQKVLNFIKKTPSDQKIIFDAIINYLMIIKSCKNKNPKLKQIFFDEEYLKGNNKGTWRELLVRYDLIEFLEVGYVEIY